MSGKYCPSCFKLTFYLTRTGHKCTQCGHSETDPSRAYMGEPGVRFSVESLKHIGSTRSSKPAKKDSAQSELDRLIKRATDRRK